MYVQLINSKVYCVLLICWTLKSVNSAEDIFDSDKSKQIIKLAKAADIKGFLDQHINPCNDFYNFACGTWQRINSAQFNDNINTDRLQSLAKGIERRLNNLLRNQTNAESDAEHKIRDFYDSCQNTNNGKYHGELAKVYKSIGEFSVFKAKQQTKESDFNWSSTVAEIQNKYGIFIILSVYIFGDLNDKTKTIPYIGPPEFTMTQGSVNIVHAIQKDRIRKYLQIYFNMSQEDAATMATNIITFEKNLVVGASDIRLGKTVTELLTRYNTTVLCEKYKDLFDVKEYLEIALGSKDLPQEVYVYDESYMKGLYEVFKACDWEDVENYILWLYINEYIIDIKSRDKREECIIKTKKYFGKFIDHVIYNQYRTNKSEKEIDELWNSIKSAFKHNLESDKYYWMSNETRSEAIRKLNKMKLSINSYDNDDFIKLFKNLNIDRTNYVINVQNILGNAESLRENKLEKKTEEDAQVLSYTPVYNILENEIRIPISLLQPRFIWDPNYPKAIQYGALGYLLAHEMLHGFDDEGRNYDSNGNANNWWDEKSVYEFESRRKCFVDQYHNYTYHGKRLPKSILQSENIADNGGLNIAYEAYVNWLNNRKLSDANIEAKDTLPRLRFNNRQLFFISFAQDWCEDIHELFRSTFANTDSHAPGIYRVIGSLSNSREFSWSFKCNENISYMDPPKKCKIY